VTRSTVSGQKGQFFRVLSANADRSGTSRFENAKWQMRALSPVSGS